jgi:hypothetical protein
LQNNVSVTLADGDGRFPPHTGCRAASGAESVAAADGKGRSLDPATADRAADSISVLPGFTP